MQPGALDPVEILRTHGLADHALATRALLIASKQQRDEEALAVVVQQGGCNADHAGLLQAFGLAARNVGDLRTAVDALTKARRIAPADALIAHGVARARLDAGLPAVNDFQLCRRLAPTDGTIIQGLAAAHLAAGYPDEGAAVIAEAVHRNPLWIDGHETLVRLRTLMGDPDDLRSFREAITLTPPNPALWISLLRTTTAAERFGEIPEIITKAKGHIGPLPQLDLFAAIAADEQGDAVAAARFFDAFQPQDAAMTVWNVRSLVRRGALREAAALAYAGTSRPDGRILWPYVALLWRALGDPRWTWLEGDGAFVQVHDLSDQIGDLVALAKRLRALHRATHQPLDQSVRGGTQTDGPLFSRLDPEIVALTKVVREAVEKYVASLPPRDPQHPLLAPRRDHIRFAGSWSVRLTGGGRHSDHVHSHGWISSALYVSLPETIDARSDVGWLTLGGSSALLPDVAPFMKIEPRPGRLVLFPSTMWHGTQPFPSGERLTVAFDVAKLN